MSVVVIGSSVANGKSVDRGRSWYEIVDASCSLNFSKCCVNGSTICTALERFNKMKDDIDTVILSFSVANEGLWVPWMGKKKYAAIADRFVQDTLTTYQRIKECQKKCLVIGIYPNGLYHGEQCAALDSIELALSTALQRDYINILQPLGGCRWHAQYRTFLDPFHPNAAAHKIIAKRVLERVFEFYSFGSAVLHPQ